MDLKQLRALLAIAETGSVTRAADILHIVQPALSRQLKLLEEELGVALFERERHGMVLTSAGRTFAEYARRALDELDSGKAEISPRKQQISGSVVVGFLPSAADLLVSSVMWRVRQSYPKVEIRSYISYLSDLERSLQQGEIDVALLYLKDGNSVGFPNEPLVEERLYLVGPPDAGLTMDRPVTLAELNQVPLILPALPHGVRELLERECQSAEVSLNVVAETVAMHLQKSLVMKGVGLSVLPGYLMQEEVARGVLTACPISAVNLKRTLYLALAANKAPTTVVQKVVEELRESVQTCMIEGRWPGGEMVQPSRSTG